MHGHFTVAPKGTAPTRGAVSFGVACPNGETTIRNDRLETNRARSVLRLKCGQSTSHERSEPWSRVSAASSFYLRWGQNYLGGREPSALEVYRGCVSPTRVIQHE